MLKGYKLPVPRHAVAAMLALVAIGLVAASIGVNLLNDPAGNGEMMAKLLKKLDLDSEANNLPTWFQSSILLLSSFLLLTIAAVRRNIGAGDVRFWMLLGGVFAYLSLDESISIHEQMTVPLRSVMPAHGVFFFAWVIPALLLVGAVFLLCVKTLWSLSVRTRLLMMASGALYMFGAVGMEMVGGSYYEVNIEATKVVDMTYVVFTTIEESFEMAGIVLFVFTLLRFIEEEVLTVGSLREAEIGEGVHDPGEVGGLFDEPSGQLNMTLSAACAPVREVTRAAQHEFSNGRVLRPRFSK